MSTERQSGFYWIKAPKIWGYSTWVVAEWFIPEDGHYPPRWDLPGTDIHYTDNSFEAIIDTPIPPPTE